MRFLFKARTKDGNVKDGVVEAADHAAAVRVLQKNNLLPISVQEEKSGSQFLRNIERSWEGLDEKDLAGFFRELATLIQASVPITQALRAIESQSENKFLRRIVRDIATDVEEGTPLSDGFAKYPDVFSVLAISVIRSGEISGNLHNSILFVADNLEKSYQLNARIKSALFYPLFVVVAAAIIGFLTVSFILPKLTQVIKDFGIPDIPWYTVVVMAIGDFMSVYWWAVLIVIFALIGSGWFYLKTEAGKYEWDHIKLKLPIFGRLFKYIYVARFAQNFSLLLAGGIPVVQALVIVADVVDNTVYKSVLLRAADEVKVGGMISTVLFDAPEMTPMVARMVKIGEETGKMDETLKSVSNFYDAEIATITRNLTTMLEPVLIIALGIGVAVLVFSILMPIYNIAGQL